tara:strand:+ start:3381 stop:5201 length:1821 start_codon:yes stop_codon:yes gene_type:complete
MKRIFYCLAILGMTFVGCDPMEDIYDDLETTADPIVGSESYTLTGEDYSDLDLGFGSFSSDEDARTMLPGFLSDRYPFWGEGSSVLVGFDLYVGNAFDIRDYNLDQDNYTFSGSDGLGFNSDDDPQDYLTDILTASVENPSAGDYRRAKYFQYTGDFVIVTPTVSLDENFDYGTAAGDLTALGSTNWEAHSGAGSGPIGYATTSLSMTDYPSSNVGGSITIDADASEDVSSYFPEISSGNVYASALVNLSTVSTGTYSFHLRDSDFAVGYVARVGAKDDGSGNILFGIGASSSSLTYGTTSFDLNTTYLLVSSYNIETGISNLYILDAAEANEPTTPEATSTGEAGAIITGVSIRQGFGGPTAVIDGVRVANSWSAIMSNDVLDDEVVGDKLAYEMYFEFTGTEWEMPSDGFYAITDEDFESMGIESFGSSISPEDYLSTFLDLKYPYAQEGDALDIGYNYESSSSGSGARGNLYTFTDGAWTAYQSTISTTLQFGYVNGMWEPDNTIRYTLGPDDYAAIATGLAVAYPNATESMSNYGNMDRRAGNAAEWTNSMVLEAINIVLDINVPSAAEDQKYVITIEVYNGSNTTEDFAVIKTGGEWIYQN